MAASNDNNDWRSNAFRQRMVEEFEKARLTSGVTSTKNPMEMENAIFIKAKSRGAYMSNVARFLVYIKELGAMKAASGIAGDQNPAQVRHPGLQYIDSVQHAMMWARLNQMVGGGVMNQPGMVQMPGGPTMMQPGGSGQAHSAVPSSSNEPRGRQNQLRNPQNFMQLAQNVSSQLQQSQMHNFRMQNQQLENMQMQDAQHQDHMRNTQMSGVPMGGAQMQNAQLGNVQVPNPQLGSVRMCNDQVVPNSSDSSTDDDL